MEYRLMDITLQTDMQLLLKELLLLLPFKIKILLARHGLLAESHEEFAHENRVRMFMALDKIFNYFASYQVTKSSGKQTTYLNTRHDRQVYNQSHCLCHFTIETEVYRPEVHDDDPYGLLRGHHP